MVVDGTGKGGRGVEITLNALPTLQGQTSIAGMNIATTPEFILFHRTGRAHVIGSDIDGGWVTACGERLSGADAVLVLKTTPWVGRVRADGSLHADSPWWCGRCIPDDTDGPLEEGGRFGEQTDISRDYRFSSDMTATAVNNALATRLLFDVAGESYRPGYPDNLLQLADVLRTMDGREWMAAVLRRDPNNEYDRYAIEVHVPGSSGHCGFVPGQLAKILAPILESGTVISASAVEVHPPRVTEQGRIDHRVDTCHALHVNPSDEECHPGRDPQLTGETSALYEIIRVSARGGDSGRYPVQRRQAIEPPSYLE